jgi:hypothetical protein
MPPVFLSSSGRLLKLGAVSFGVLIELRGGTPWDRGTG